MANDAGCKGPDALLMVAATKVRTRNGWRAKIAGGGMGGGWGHGGNGTVRAFTMRSLIVREA